MKPKPKRSSPIVLLSIVMLILACGLCWWWYSSNADETETLASLVCAYVQTDYGQACASDVLYDLYPEELQACLPSGELLATDANLNRWIACLENQGIALIRD